MPYIDIGQPALIELLAYVEIELFPFIWFSRGIFQICILNFR